MKILSAAAMRSADRQTIEEYGLSGAVLMETAGMRVSGFVSEHLAGAGKVVVLAGPGNNGGDGIVVARQLRAAKKLVSLWSTQKQGAYRGEAAANESFYLKSGGAIRRLLNREDLAKLTEELAEADLIVDSLLGTGTNREITGLTADLINAVNETDCPVLSVDIPSGINADSGEVMGAAVQADWTITFAFPKTGLFLFPGAGKAGTVYVADIYIPKQTVEDTKVDLLTPAMVKNSLPDRPADGHKGTMGRVAVVAGSPGMTGAAVLAAESALRAGAGLVYLAAPASACAALRAKLVEVITVELPDNPDGMIKPEAAGQIIELSRNCDALACGPGLMTGDDTARLLESLIQLSPVPLILDAGALGALGSRLGILRSAKNLPVITPHPGEMARLLGVTTGQVQSQRLQVALKHAALWNCIIALKGANTIIADPLGNAVFNPTGSTTLATAGSGDLLTGMIASFIAQGMCSEKAVCSATFIHGLAGEFLPSVRGSLARLILDQYPRVFKWLASEAAAVIDDSCMVQLNHLI